MLWSLRCSAFQWFVYSLALAWLPERCDFWCARQVRARLDPIGLRPDGVAGGIFPDLQNAILDPFDDETNNQPASTSPALCCVIPSQPPISTLVAPQSLYLQDHDLLLSLQDRIPF